MGGTAHGFARYTGLMHALYSATACCQAAGTQAA